MKILLFTLEYPPFKGGVAKYYANLVEHWPEPENISVLDNKDKRLLKSFIYPRWLFALFALRKAIRRGEIDHVIVGHILPLGTVAYFLSKVMKFKYSVVLHGMDIKYADKVWRKRRLANKILKKAERVICCNTHTAEFVCKNFTKKLDGKIFVVNPGIDTEQNINLERAEELKQKYRLAGKPVVFSLGRLVKRKGFDMMLKALPEVQKYHPDLFYVLAGDGPDKEYIKDQGKGVKNVLFLGKISEEDKWAWLSICDVFAMPSREMDGDVEGFGIVYLEAGLCAKPVLAGNSGGVSDAVVSAVTGIMVAPEDIEKIANSVLILLNKDEGRKMGEASQTRILKDFSAKKQAGDIYKIIK